MTNRSIGVGFAPDQDGRTINDEIAGPHQTGVQGLLHAENEEGFMHWGSSREGRRNTGATTIKARIKDFGRFKSWLRWCLQVESR